MKEIKTKLRIWMTKNWTRMKYNLQEVREVMMMLVNQEVRKSKKGKTCQLFSLWKLTHYLFLFYEGNEDEIEDMDDEELDEDEIQSTGGQRSDDDASKSGGKKK